MIIKFINLILLLIAFGVCVFLFVAYSELLDFFPWGNNKSYVVWEPLVLYFIIPSFILIGVLKLLLGKKSDPILSNLLFLVIGIVTALPVIIGFDLETDLVGRWTGVFTALLSISLIVVVMCQEVLTIKSKNVDNTKANGNF